VSITSILLTGQALSPFHTPNPTPLIADSGQSEQTAGEGVEEGEQHAMIFPDAR